MVRLLVVVALVAGACRFDADYGGTSYRCDDQSACPDDPDGSDEWRGTYHLVAVYCRALEELEVARNFAAGAG